MGATEDFEGYLAWQEALLRVHEREPEVCEAVAALDAEYVLFGHHDDPRRGVEALKRAIATERGRKTLADFGHALIRTQNEIARELRGEPDQTLPTEPLPRSSIPEGTPPEQVDEGGPRERMERSKTEKRRAPSSPSPPDVPCAQLHTPWLGLGRPGASHWRGP